MAQHNSQTLTGPNKKTKELVPPAKPFPTYDDLALRHPQLFIFLRKDFFGDAPPPLPGETRDNYNLRRKLEKKNLEWIDKLWTKENIALVYLQKELDQKIKNGQRIVATDLLLPIDKKENPPGKGKPTEYTLARMKVHQEIMTEPREHKGDDWSPKHPYRGISYDLWCNLAQDKWGKILDLLSEVERQKITAMAKQAMAGRAHY